jgi:hypothetical protein
MLGYTCLMLPCFQRQRSVSQPYRCLTGLRRAKSLEGIEERCQVERRTDLYRSIGLVVVLLSYNQVKSHLRFLNSRHK